MPGSKKTSPVWKNFVDDQEDYTSVICQIPGCLKKVSRGKKDTPRAKLSNSSMKAHIKTHEDEWKQFIADEKEIMTNKRKNETDAKLKNEMNLKKTKVFGMKTKQETSDYIEQIMPGNSKIKKYSADSPEAKHCHRGVVAHIVMDLKPFNEVYGPGFLQLLASTDPHYEVMISNFYKSCVEKAYKNAVDELKKSIGGVETTAISLQIDGWSQH